MTTRLQALLAVLDKLPEEALALVDGDPSKGSRSDTVLEVANYAGAAGCSNHEIILVAEELYDRWGLFPADRNLYERYDRLRRIVINVRKHYDASGNPKG